LTKVAAADVLSADQLREFVVSSLEDFKAVDIQVIDVRGRNPLADFFVIASGSSSRHVKSMGENLVLKAKQAGFPPLGVEGQRQGDWVLVDMNDIIVHIMRPQTRAFYNLEKLWEASHEVRNESVNGASGEASGDAHSTVSTTG
jgi:ribosome-associated protein